MQRWIALAALLLVLFGGAVFGFWKYKQSQPDKRYVPLAFHPESSDEQRVAEVKLLRDKLLTDAILTGVARDCDIERKWDLSGEKEAVADLRRRVILEAGETRMNGVPTPTMNIGFRGTVGERPELNALSERLMQDVQRLITAGNPQAQPAPAAN